MYARQTGNGKGIELDVEITLAVQAEWENHTGKTKENEIEFHDRKIVVEVVLLFEKNKLLFAEKINSATGTKMWV